MYRGDGVLSEEKLDEAEHPIKLVGSGLTVNGILAQGGSEAFWEASQINIIIFNKTGTLTKGSDPLANHSLWANMEDLSNMKGNGVMQSSFNWLLQGLILCAFLYINT